MDAAAFGSYALLWFITFVYMASEWGEVTSDERDRLEGIGGNPNTIQAAIAFSFFAILIWVSFSINTCVYVLMCACTGACAYAHTHTVFAAIYTVYI